LPWFAQSVARMRAEPSDTVPTLVADPAGQVWHITQSDSERARSELWSVLQDPATFQ
jgi:hypothetical protein